MQKRVTNHTLTMEMDSTKRRVNKRKTISFSHSFDSVIGNIHVFEKQPTLATDTDGALTTKTTSFFSHSCDSDDPDHIVRATIRDVHAFGKPHTDTESVIELQQPISVPTPTPVKVTADDLRDNDYTAHNDNATSIHKTTAPNPDILQQLDAQTQSELQNHIRTHLTCNALLWIRICVLILTVILVLLSLSYALGSMGSTELVLITQCPGHELDEIWEHSELINSPTGARNQNTGQRSLNCWSTTTLLFDEVSAYTQNTYQYQYQPEIAQCVIFSVLSFCSVCILLYGIHALITDLLAVRQQKLYTKSTKFKHLIQGVVDPSLHVSAKLGKRREQAHFITICKGFYAKCGMQADTNAYAARKIMVEVWEIALQTFALLLYNGYNLWSPNDVSLAHKPKYIYLFASVLSFNCLSVGILWALYALKPNKCNGYIFQLLVFCTDEFCDLFYVIYPFIVVFDDDYNAFGDDGEALKIGFALLNNTELSSFIYSVFPMVLLCTKSLFMTRSTAHEMRNQSFDLWVFVTKIMNTSDDKKIAYLSTLLGFTIHSNNQKALALSSVSPGINDEIYDHQGKLQLNISKSKWNGPDTASRRTKCRISIVLISALFIAYSIVLLSTVIHHLTSAEQYCNDPNHKLSVLTHHPELFVYNQCEYQVHPFSFSHDQSDKCECRSFRIYWGDMTIPDDYIQHNITRISIIDGVLTQWTMMEKFDSLGEMQNDTTNQTFAFSPSHFRASHMKLFNWNNINIIQMDDAIGEWKELLSFSMADVSTAFTFPPSFSELHQLKAMQLMQMNTNITLELFCNFTHIILISIVGCHVSSIPRCFSHLPNLELLTVHLTEELTSFPLELLNSSSLQKLDLWQSGVTYEGLLNANTLCNDSDPFSCYPVRDGLEVVLSRTRMCKEAHRLPGSVNRWMATHNACLFGDCDARCPPVLLGDGQCSNVCNYTSCSMDGGDCYQFCFTKTECNYTQFLNDKCDPECNNEECFWDSGNCRNDTVSLPLGDGTGPGGKMPSMNITLSPGGSVPGNKEP
eukprot:88043_1